MMISVGYYFDQVSRERMAQRISEQPGLIAAARPTDAPVINATCYGSRPHIRCTRARRDVEGGGDGIPELGNSRISHSVRGSRLRRETVTVTVVDPTPFVRDPEIRANALTVTSTWKVSGAAATQAVT